MPQTSIDSEHQRPAPGPVDVDDASATRRRPRAAWAIRPSRRSANSSAHTCAQQRRPAGPSSRRACRSGCGCPSRSTLPTTRSASPRPSAVAPYRKAISPEPEAAERVDVGEHDPDRDEVEAGDHEGADGQHHERRAVGPATRIHIAARIANARTSQRQSLREALSHPGPPPCGRRAGARPAQASSSTAPQQRLERRARRARPARGAGRARCRPAPGGTPPTAAPATMLRNGSGNSTSGTTSPQKNIANTDDRVSTPALVEQPERARRDQQPDREADHDRRASRETRKASAGQRASSGSAGRTAGRRRSSARCRG